MTQTSNSVPYEKEIMQMLAEFHESWMDEDDKRKFNAELLNVAGGMQKISNDFQAGARNGMSVDQQLKLVQNMIRAVI